MNDKVAPETMLIPGFVLSIPAKRESAWAAEVKPRRAIAWAKRLPLNNAMEAARELYHNLYTLNRMELSAYDRIDLLRIHRKPVAFVSAALQVSYKSSPLPLMPKKRRLAEFIRTLQMEMAIGYKCALNELPKLRLPWRKRSVQGAALAGAMHYLGEVMQRSYEIYISYPNGIWREIHELYKYAESKKRLQQPLDVFDGVVDTKTTLEERYKQILLMSLAHPYHLQRDMCRNIQLFLYRWSTQAQVTHMSTAINTASNYLVDLVTDSPPMPYPDKESVQGGELRILNTQDIVKSVNFFINRMRAGVAARSLNIGFEALDSITLEVMHTMVRTWEAPLRRKYSRARKEGNINVCMGIKALHFFSNNEKPFVSPDPADASGAYLEEEPRDDEVDLSGDDTEEEIDIHSLDQDTVEEDGPDKDPGTPQDREFARTQEIFLAESWQIIDQSAKGLSLRYGGRHPSSFHIGDLLGLQESTGAPWLPYVIRWLRSPHTHVVEVGVELLGASPVPVAVKTGGGETFYSRHFTQALLLPEVPKLKKSQSLIIPRAVHQDFNDIILVESGDGPSAQRRIRVNEVLLKTGALKHVTFR